MALLLSIQFVLMRHLYLYNTCLIIKLLLQKYDNVDNVIKKITKISLTFGDATYFNKIFINLNHLVQNYSVDIVNEYVQKLQS